MELHVNQWWIESTKHYSIEDGGRIESTKHYSVKGGGTSVEKEVSL